MASVRNKIKKSLEQSIKRKCLLDEQMAMLSQMRSPRHRKIGFDGWGIQGQAVSNILHRSFREKGLFVNAIPVRLNVSNYIPFVQRLFLEKKILISKKVMENEVFRDHFFNFTIEGKKKGSYDAVDAMFCGIYMLIELEYFTNR